MAHHANICRGYRPGYRTQGLPGIIQHAGDTFDYSDGDRSRYGETILGKLRVSA